MRCISHSNSFLSCLILLIFLLVFIAFPTVSLAQLKDPTDTSEDPAVTAGDPTAEISHLVNTVVDDDGIPEGESPSSANLNSIADEVLKKIEDDPIPPVTPDQQASNPVAENVQVEHDKAKVAVYSHVAWSYEFRQQIFEWQFFTSKVVFYVVLIVVGMGLYFSWVQFTSTNAASQDDQEDAKSTEKNEEDSDKEAQSERLPFMTRIVLNFRGISFSSPTLGVVILFMSLIFFYLYLQYVYPITRG